MFNYAAQKLAKSLDYANQQSLLIDDELFADFAAHDTPPPKTPTATSYSPGHCHGHGHYGYGYDRSPSLQSPSTPTPAVMLQRTKSAPVTVSPGCTQMTQDADVAAHVPTPTHTHPGLYIPQLWGSSTPTPPPPPPPASPLSHTSSMSPLSYKFYGSPSHLLSRHKSNAHTPTTPSHASHASSSQLAITEEERMDIAYDGAMVGEKARAYKAKEKGVETHAQVQRRMTQPCQKH